MIFKNLKWSRDKSLRTTDQPNCQKTFYFYYFILRIVCLNFYLIFLLILLISTPFSVHVSCASRALWALPTLHSYRFTNQLAWILNFIEYWTVAATWWLGRQNFLENYEEIKRVGVVSFMELRFYNW